MHHLRDRWAAGTTYEDFMGRWGRQVAPRFVSWLRVPSQVHWLDVGCGTGALTSAICEKADPASVVGCDPAEPFIEYARELDEGSRFPVCNPESLLEIFHSGGLSEARCDAIEIPTEFSSFDDYWRPFLGGTGPAPSYVASLDTDRREVFAGKLERALPRRPDGTIALVARAWAVRGIA